MSESNLDIKQLCCFIFDRCIQPRYEKEQEEREVCAEILEHFLRTTGISFDAFFSYVRNYSLGVGLQYMKEVNEMIPFLRHEIDSYEQYF